VGEEARECGWRTVRSQGRWWEPVSRQESLGADGETSEANKSACAELRKESSERARGWGTSAGYGRLSGGIRGRSKG